MSSAAHPAVSVFDSTVEAVDTAEEVTLDYAQSVGFEEDDRYYIGLALREVFVNAVKHGNRFDATKKVVLQLSNPDGALVIEVTDQGGGFAVEDVPNPHAPENLHNNSGRGLLIASHVMDELRVSSGQPTGTHVTMIKRVTSQQAASPSGA